MAEGSSFQETMTETMGAEEILNIYKANYVKVRKLIDEDSKNDPANDPHLSKYKAKEILCAMKVNLLKHTASEKLFKGNRLEAMLGAVLLNIGIIDIDTDDLTSSDSVLSEAVTILAPYSSKPEIVITLIEVYNNLVKDSDGKMPVKLECDFIRPVATAHVLIAKHSSKKIAFNKTMQLEYMVKSYESFQAAVDMCERYEDAAAMMKDELSSYKEMVDTLPLKIKTLLAELAA
ncbi:Uncharacterized protein OBRU01_22257 [Operophtera brumata]|uniref:KIF-binding protein n=1 Tax=Operophtera brumata TaxID=104452 RepID=A0A0L7KRX7_OPEBR|nr:Uncharacterized protein OBRU01_22257 [Operophtera brumata]